MRRKKASKGYQQPDKAPTNRKYCVECHSCDVEIHDTVVRVRSSGAPLRWPLCVECMGSYDVIEDYGVIE